MKILKRSLLIVLCLVFISTLFSSCKSGGGDSSDVEVEISTADINFVDADGEAVYRIVRADGDEDLSSHASTIIKAIKSKFNVSTKNVTDAEEKGDFAEIVLGESNREVTKKAKQLLNTETNGRRDDFVICSIGNDIAIYGGSLEATIAAIKYFADTYITGEVITGGIHYANKSDANYTDVSLAGNTRLSDFKLVTPIYNTSYITELQITELLGTIATKTGYSITRLDDNVASKTGNINDGSGTLTPTEANEYEIIIGNATRDGVKTFKDYNTYEIRVEGKKVFLNGGSPYATAMAVSEFAKLINNSTAISADNNVLSGDYNTALKNYDLSTYYRPTWTDEFDGADIDYSKWYVAWDETVSYYSGPANGKGQYRGSSKYKNNYVKDGLMYQVAVEDTLNYYGGLFNTNEIMNFLYGYLELSTIHPKGMGFWSALWTCSKPEAYDEWREAYYFSETDLDECYGEGTYAFGNVFAWPTEYGKPYLDIPEGTTGAICVSNRKSCEDDRGYYLDFHTFGFEWLDNTHVRFAVDGEVYVDYMLRDGPETLAYSQPQYLILSLSCGSGNHGEPTTDPVEWEKYNKFIADWVHIYQKKGQKLYNFNKDTRKYFVVSE